MSASTNPPFSISRDFDAPRDLVFRAWTEADRLAAWFGPVGFTTFSSRLDLRPGGQFHYGMRAPNGSEMWGKWVFREVKPPERLVFVASFSDEGAATTRAPFAGDWPLEVLSTVTFAEKGGRTTLTMTAEPVNATDAERKRFADGFESMTKGWGGTLDALAAYLARK
jgi:uncharacterized protein YndB with AHSA1/START domain